MVHITPMQIPVSEAKSLLTDLVRRAEAGEEIVLTRHGQSVVRLTPVTPAVTTETRRRVIETARGGAAAKLREGPSAARSQDFLYRDDGLPG